MRVLTIGNLYPPHHFGGAEQVWSSAVGSLRVRGHDVRVLATDYRHPGQEDGEEPDVSRQLRWYWTEHDFARLGMAQRLEIERHNQSQLTLQLAQLRPDVISFWSMGGMSHSLIEQVRRRGLPIVSFVHDPWLDYGRWTDQWMRLFRLRRYRWSARFVEGMTGLPTSVDYGAAGRYVFVSEFLRRRMLDLGLGLTDTAVASSGIASPFSSAGTPNPWQWRLLHVGRLHPDKGTEDAVRSLTALPAEARLTFAGSWDPREEAALQETVRGLGLEDRVTMLGQLPAQEVAKLYRSGDVLLFPSRWEEPWGLVPLEAMGCGCPVIATGRGGSGEYLRDGDNCLLVPVRDPAALAAAVRRLAHDAALRERIRSGGSLTAARHSEEAFNQAVEAHLDDAVQRRPTGAPASGLRS